MKREKSRKESEKIMTKHILQNFWILLLALLTLGFAFLLVLDFIPANPSGMEVREKIDVSSSVINTADHTHISSVQGFLRNATNETITVEKITVEVSNREGLKKIVEVEGGEVLPRTDMEVAFVWEGGVAYDRVTSVKVTVNGETDLIPNTPKTFILNASTIVYLILTAVSAFFLIWVCKVRYYMYQEDMEKVKEQDS